MKIRMISGLIVCVVMAYIAVILHARGEESEMHELVVTSADASTELRAVLRQIVDIHEKKLEIVTRKFTTDQVG